MNEILEFKKAVKKINHIRKAKGKEPIRYMVDFGEKRLISHQWKEISQIIFPLLQYHRSQSYRQDQSF